MVAGVARVTSDVNRNALSHKFSALEVQKNKEKIGKCRSSGRAKAEERSGC